MAVFSQRTGWDREPNPLARAVAERRAAGREVLDLSESNPTRCGLAWDEDVLRAALAMPGVSAYEPDPRGLPSARSALSAWLSRRGTPCAEERLFLTASTSEAYSWVFRLLCDPGDAVLVPQPSYPLFDYLAGLDAVDSVAYRLKPERGTRPARWRLDVEGIADALPQRAKAVLVVAPNNPTGSFVAEDEARALARLCRERRLALVSDEVFADFAWDAPRRERPPSLLAAAEAEGCLGLVLSGLSKSCGLPQAKLGWIAVAGDEALVAEALGRLELVADTFLSAGTAVQLALPRLLEGGAGFRERLLSRVLANADWLEEQAAAKGAVMLRPEAGWQALLSLPHVLDEEEFVTSLVTADGVHVQPGFYFDLRGGPHVAVSLLPEPATFRAGVTALLARAN